MSPPWPFGKKKETSPTPKEEEDVPPRTNEEEVPPLTKWQKNKLSKRVEGASFERDPKAKLVLDDFLKEKKVGPFKRECTHFQNFTIRSITCNFK